MTARSLRMLQMSQTHTVHTLLLDRPLLLLLLLLLRPIPPNLTWMSTLSCLVPSIFIIVHILTQSASSLHSTCMKHLTSCVCFCVYRYASLTHLSLWCWQLTVVTDTATASPHHCLVSMKMDLRLKLVPELLMLWTLHPAT